MELYTYNDWSPGPQPVITALVYKPTKIQQNQASYGKLDFTKSTTDSNLSQVHSPRANQLATPKWKHNHASMKIRAYCGLLNS